MYFYSQKSLLKKLHMNKGIVYYISVLLIIITSMACKRSHVCYCQTSGAFDTTLIREYRGYSKNEARQLCKADEFASTNVVKIECDLHR